ncbi:MAG: hypothetical protein KF758_11365 [Anaerolineales bacterium]|nr:hypothetical protein [Anaerolineales bacterium]
MTTLRSFELDMIKQDVIFYYDIMPKLALRESIGVLIFGLMPYLSLFTVETYNYFQKNYPEKAKLILREHESIISASRMRIKLFDDKEKRIDGVFDLLKWIIDFNREKYINEHKGFLAPLKRALQDDLGIFLYQGHVIGSTHVGLFNIGYDKSDFPEIDVEFSDILKKMSESVGFSLGRYLGQLCSLLGLSPDNIDSIFIYNIDDGEMKYKDAKADRYFNNVFNGNKTIDLNFGLLLFLATTNFMQYSLMNIVSNTPPTLFKLKFIMLYHLASSLEKLKKYYYADGLLRENSKLYFQEILEDDELKFLKKQKEFRNTLIHYSIREIPENKLNKSKELFGLVEYYFIDRDYYEIDKMLDRQILRISSILEKWMDWKVLPNQLSNW